MNRKSENPWKILSSRIVYESPFLKIVEDKVITPEGKEGIHNLVFGGRGSTGGACVAALNDRGELYLVEQYRYAYGGYTLELVNGGVDDGESPLEAAKRELAEEANITAKNWKLLANSYAGTESLKWKGYIYLATGICELNGNYKGENNMRILKVSLSKAADLVMQGKVPLAESALAILMVERLISK